MSTPKRTVLITGCSDGGLGAGLAITFHEAGLHVYATSRDPSKMAGLQARGIETLTLDVLSDSSIAACVAKVSSLDILVNNAGGGGLPMPISDLDIQAAKDLFDLNVWSCIAVAKAFTPLLVKSKGVIANQTSVGAVTAFPFQATYNASKAAMTMYSDTMRLELAPFDIMVVDLKTGMVKSNLVINNKRRAETSGSTLPNGSIYESARELVEKRLRGEGFDGMGVEQRDWAEGVVRELLKKKPKPKIWSGAGAWGAWFGTILPFGMLDGTLTKMSGLDAIEEVLRTK